MATLGFLVVIPEECRAVWTLARADVEGAGDSGLACEEFCLLGHTWSLQMYPETESSKGAATTAPCSIMVGSREKGPVKASVTLNGVAQTLDHVFGSGAREILRWRGFGANDSENAPMAFEVVFHIYSVGEEASKRAAGELSLVQQLGNLKMERTELHVRVAALSDELQALQEALKVSETGRAAEQQKVTELSMLLSALETKAAALEEPAKKCPLLEAALAEQQAENKCLTDERTQLHEDLRDLRDDHETLTQRFALAQELKAKSEVVAYHAENEKASLEGQLSTIRGEMEAKIEAVQLEKVSLEGELEKLRPAVEGLSGERQSLLEKSRRLQAERDAEASKVQGIEAENAYLQTRAQDLQAANQSLQSKVEMYEKKKKGFFN